MAKQLTKEINAAWMEWCPWCRKETRHNKSPRKAYDGKGNEIKSGFVVICLKCNSSKVVECISEGK